LVATNYNLFSMPDCEKKQIIKIHYARWNN
ncbi:hypothetical protein X975_16104, partial [Stegodyphus mimosarum]